MPPFSGSSPQLQVNWSPSSGVGSIKNRYIGQSRQSVLYQKKYGEFRGAKKTKFSEVAQIAFGFLPRTVRDLLGEPDIQYWNWKIVSLQSLHSLRNAKLYNSPTVSQVFLRSGRISLGCYNWFESSHGCEYSPICLPPLSGDNIKTPPSVRPREKEFGIFLKILRLRRKHLGIFGEILRPPQQKCAWSARKYLTFFLQFRRNFENIWPYW